VIIVWRIFMISLCLWSYMNHGNFSASEALLLCLQQWVFLSKLLDWSLWRIQMKKRMCLKNQSCRKLYWSLWRSFTACSSWLLWGWLGSMGRSFEGLLKIFDKSNYARTSHRNYVVAKARNIGFPFLTSYNSVCSGNLRDEAKLHFFVTWFLEWRYIIKTRLGYCVG